MNKRRVKLSIVIPVLNEGDGLRLFLQALPNPDPAMEIILADGGSTDGSVSNIANAVSRVVVSKKGRANQMNAGAAAAAGDYLLFLHADTYLPAGFRSLIQAGGADWGRFDVRLSGDHWAFRVIEFMMTWKSNKTGICTGDQAIFVKRSLFESLGGYAAIPLMEDIELSNRLRRISPPLRVQSSLTTSSRRWEDKGILKTVLLMWYLRHRYAMGTSPEILVKKYYK